MPPTMICVRSVLIERLVGSVCLSVLAALSSSCLVLGAESSATDKGKTTAAAEPKWETLFDGQTLKNWEILAKYDYKNHGRVHVSDGCLVLEKGSMMSGVRWTGKMPEWDYEICLEGKRVDGSDFFCGMTFPVGKQAMTLILGGWGGSLVGFSSIDGMDASENETTQGCEFEQNRWYKIRLQVTASRIRAWLDDKQIIDLEAAGRKFGVRWEMEPCIPLGFATYDTSGALRNVRFRLLSGEPATKPEGAKP